MVTERLRGAIDSIRGCEHRSEKALLAMTAAIVSACMLRALVAIAALMLPQESWAAGLAAQAMSLSTEHFGLACGIAAIGGASSLFHELRANIARFTLVNAVGHMTLAQFAGLLVYLIAVQYGWQLPIALVGCGLSGWGGNRTIVALNDVFLRRIGLDERSRR